jgi:hypothetical protein
VTSAHLPRPLSDQRTGVRTTKIGRKAGRPDPESLQRVALNHGFRASRAKSEPPVIPAKAGTQTWQTSDVALRRPHFLCWVPAYAAMTIQFLRNMLWRGLAEKVGASFIQHRVESLAAMSSGPKVCPTPAPPGARDHRLRIVGHSRQDADPQAVQSRTLRPLLPLFNPVS